MPSSKPNGAPIIGATPRTLEDFERYEEAIREAERAALRQLVDTLRELALGLPVESKLARRFAKGAKTLELFSHGSSVLTAGPMVRYLVEDIREDAAERFYLNLLAMLEDAIPAMEGTADAALLIRMRSSLEIRLEAF